MRIITGKLRGKHIAIPKKFAIRPTASKVRAQVFNIVGSHIVGANVFELFAGSGAIGIEAISRGATFCTFVESNVSTIRLLRRNLELLGISPQARIFPFDAARAVQRASRATTPFSFIYIDPPYDQIGEIPDLLQKIDGSVPMVDGTILFIESRTNTFTPPPLTRLKLVSSRTSGGTELWEYGITSPDEG